MSADVLIYMGYVLDRDFVAFADRVDWKIQKPPTDAEIKAAEPLAIAALQAQAAQKVESDTARDDAKRAIEHLDTIIAGIDGATLAQAKTAIKQLAQIQQHIILATLGR